MKTKHKILLFLAALAISTVAVAWAKETAGSQIVIVEIENKKDSGCVKVGPNAWDCTESLEVLKEWHAWETEQLEEDLEKAKSLRRKVSVTGYSSRVQETDSTPCISADGSDICKLHAQGENICATNDYPMHTVLTIEGHGTCIVRDRMNSRFTGTNRVDYYFGYDTEAAIKHGVKTAIATVVK